MSLNVVVFADGRMNGCEFLQTSFEPEPGHSTLLSPKWEVEILSSIVFPSADFLGGLIANDRHCRSI
jgi:hypothetical protein